MIPETQIATASAAEISDEVVFTLRISRDLNNKLVAEAENERRSRQGQIVYLLEKSFERREAKGNAN